MKIKNKNKALLLFSGIFIGCILVFVIVINIPIPTTFNVSVKTERLEFTTVDNNNSRLPLNRVEVYNFNGDSLGIQNGSFEIAIGSTVLVERISNGPLLIKIQGREDQSAGIFFSASQDEIERKAENFVEFIIMDPPERNKYGETIVIPISGQVILGKTINYESYASSTALVRSGTITMVGKSLIGDQFFESGTHTLNIGDQFKVVKPQSKAYGFVAINEDPGMSAAYRVLGKKGKILTPGPVTESPGYSISTNLISRFLYDSFFQGISWALASLLVIATTLPLLSDLEQYTFKKDKKKKKKK